jgi:Predicted acyltransferase
MYTFKLIKGNEDISDVINLRKEVFCDEQGYSHEEEFDELDLTAVHVLMCGSDNTVIGCGRILDENNNIFRLGRICIKKSYRSQHLGHNLMRFMIDFVKKQGALSILIGAQERVKGFYETFGFVPFDDVYMDGHVPHIAMKLTF